MTDPITVREAEAADAARLLEIYAYYIQNTAITFEYDVPSLSEFQKRIRNTRKRYPYLVIEQDGVNLGLVELIEIDHIHRRAEFQIIVDPAHQNKGYATTATRLAMDYAFMALNLYKLYLIVDTENARAIHIYTKLGFEVEGVLKHEFFSNGAYHDVTRMCIFQPRYLERLRASQTN